MRSATAVTIFLLACGVSEADDSTDMQGVWLPVEAALGMQQLPRDTLRSMRLKIAGGQYEVVVGNEADRGRLNLDATLTPKALDIVGTEGPNKGKTILGVYELTGDTLRICYNLAGDTRPRDFNPRGEAGLFVVIYKRVKQ